MKKILTADEAIQISQSLENQSVVLTGGCFDILHIGHLRFLQNATSEGDILIVLLEHDESIKKKKGHHRPLNNQNDRAEMLAALEIVDYVIKLPADISDDFYNDLVIQLKPAIIATTAGDPYRKFKENQAKQIGAKVVDVIKPITNKSTTKLVELLNEI